MHKVEGIRKFVPTPAFFRGILLTVLISTAILFYLHEINASNLAKICSIAKKRIKNDLRGLDLVMS